MGETRPNRGHRRLRWQREAGYGKRFEAETAMARYKRILGDHLHARKRIGQQTEAAIGAAVLNRMINAGRPASVRTTQLKIADRATASSLISLHQRQPPPAALPDRSLRTLEAARRQERVKLMATPGEGFGGIRHHRASSLPCHEMDKDSYGFRDTETSIEMKPCVGSRTRLRSSPAGAGPELTAETQARVERAARYELSARGLCPNQVELEPAEVQLDQLQGQDSTEPVIRISDWDGPDKPPHPRELGPLRIRPPLRAVQPAPTRVHSFQHEQAGSRTPAQLSPGPSLGFQIRPGFSFVPS
jgi:hypothetical protein